MIQILCSRKGWTTSQSSVSLVLSRFFLFQMKATTYQDNDFVLDQPFVLVEIKSALRHLKKDSSGGHDQLTPQHSPHSCPLFKNWICKTFNAIITLEEKFLLLLKKALCYHIHVKGYRKKTLFYGTVTEASPSPRFSQNPLSLLS